MTKHAKVVPTKNLHSIYFSYLPSEISETYSLKNTYIDYRIILLRFFIFSTIFQRIPTNIYCYSHCGLSGMFAHPLRAFLIMRNCMLPDLRVVIFHIFHFVNLFYRTVYASSCILFVAIMKMEEKFIIQQDGMFWNLKWKLAFSKPSPQYLVLSVPDICSQMHNPSKFC